MTNALSMPGDFGRGMRCSGRMATSAGTAVISDSTAAPSRNASAARVTTRRCGLPPLRSSSTASPGARPTTLVVNVTLDRSKRLPASRSAACWSPAFESLVALVKRTSSRPASPVADPLAWCDGWKRGRWKSKARCVVALARTATFERTSVANGFGDDGSVESSTGSAPIEGCDSACSGASRSTSRDG